MKLTKHDRDLLEKFADSAKWLGWVREQGTDVPKDRAENSYRSAYAAMERRLARKPRVSK